MQKRSEGLGRAERREAEGETWAAQEALRTAQLEGLGLLRDLETTYHQHLTDYQTALAELEAIVGADLHLSRASGPSGEVKKDQPLLTLYSPPLRTVAGYRVPQRRSGSVAGRRQSGHRAGRNRRGLDLRVRAR